MLRLRPHLHQLTGPDPRPNSAHRRRARTHRRSPLARRAALAALALAVLATGCGTNDPPEDCLPDQPLPEGLTSLIAFDDWRALPRDEDPWAHARPDEDCTRPLPHIEDGLLEFDTKICDHFAVETPLLAPLVPGDRVELVGSHSVLLADEPSSGHLVLLLGDTPLLEFETPIPGPAAVLTLSAEATPCAPPGPPPRG
ncbi:MAG: hypothetical protein EA398_17950, partial [Deltaproteobacteria bacterium]